MDTHTEKSESRDASSRGEEQRFAILFVLFLSFFFVRGQTKSVKKKEEEGS